MVWSQCHYGWVYLDYPHAGHELVGQVSCAAGSGLSTNDLPRRQRRRATGDGLLFSPAKPQQPAALQPPMNRAPDDATAAALAARLPSRARQLSLSGGQITAAGAKAISHALLPQQPTFSFPSARPTLKVAPASAPLALERIDLSLNKLRDTGVSTLLLAVAAASATAAAPRLCALFVGDNAIAPGTHVCRWGPVGHREFPVRAGVC